VRVTRADGLVTVEEATLLAGVQSVTTVRNWINRGYMLRDGSKRVKLQVARREGHLILLDPVEVAKAEWNTAGRARRVSAAWPPRAAEAVA
jgi:hypothetical protein